MSRQTRDWSFQPIACWRNSKGIVLLQVEVENKENESAAAPHLLEAVDLRDCTANGSWRV